MKITLKEKAFFLFLTLSAANICIAQDEFITTWKTDNPGVSNDNQITIPTFSGETYNYNIDWGDTNSDSNVIGDITHTYASAGTYTVTITGTFPRIYFSGLKDEQKILSIEQWGNIAWTNFQFAFEDCINLVIPTSAGIPNLTNCTSLYGMFYDASNFNSNISSWNVTTITDMTEVFYGCTNFNQPLNSWDVSNVTLMDGMFTYAMAFNQDLDSWANKLGNVTDMSNMFSDATAFNGNITNWDVSNVERMEFMFFGAANFNQNISSWNTSSVQRMQGMFQSATSFNQDIGSWNTSNVTRAERMFRQATSFDQNLGSWDLTKIVDTGFTSSGIRDMFDGTVLSTTNYDNTIIGWATDTSGTPGDLIDDIPLNIVFNGGSSTYCNSETAWNNLDTTYNWTITDGGLDCTTLSTNQFSVNAISLYPNPTKDFLFIKGDIQSINSIEIYDVTGKLVKKLNQNFNSMNLSDLVDSIYLIRVYSANKTNTLKIIKS